MLIDVGLPGGIYCHSLQKCSIEENALLWFNHVNYLLEFLIASSPITVCMAYSLTGSCFPQLGPDIARDFLIS